MSKLLTITTALKAIFMATGLTFALGDMLPVILISALFNLALQCDAKTVRQTARQDTMTTRQEISAAADLGARSSSSSDGRLSSGHHSNHYWRPTQTEFCVNEE
jgi:hypothetical protein